jgi:hypothetical protein
MVRERLEELEAPASESVKSCLPGRFACCVWHLRSDYQAEGERVRALERMEEAAELETNGGCRWKNSSK